MSNEGRRWFEQRKEFAPRPREGTPAPDTPDLWTRCPGCSEMLFAEALAENLQVCSACGYHMRIGAIERLHALLDEGELVFHDEGLGPVDALGFVDSKPYTERISATQKKVGRKDAFIAVSGAIEGIEVEVGCFDFRFMGGSMGSVVGEAITRVYERAAECGRPAIIISASGGARMQEGVLSLMQMAKTCAALAKLQDETKMPYISVLTHPTTGGVAASFAMLGDLIFAEPGALIGFAGPRVIEQTIGQSLPEGFQTSEYLLEHGMVDRIVSRTELRASLASALRMMLGQPAETKPAGPHLELKEGGKA
jgi:acetyl-CoA carboxylase carboxyl transferase subunit beta